MGTPWPLTTFVAVAITLSAGAAGAASSAQTETHARGIDRTNLTLGDYKKSSSPKRGWLYTCQPISGNPSPSTGPWIQGDSWDLTEKPTVDGAVDWNESLS